MHELVRWLSEILDTDEEWARAAAEEYGSVWTVDVRMQAVTSDTGADVVTEPNTPLDHIAEYDPARVLREVEAKRAIVARYEFACREAADDRSNSEEEREVWVKVAGALQSSVLCLAAPYADRPGYDEAVRP